MGCIVANGIMKEVGKLEKELEQIERDTDTNIKRAIELENKINELKNEAYREYT